MKHIYNYSIEGSFFKLITSPSKIAKGDDGLTIVWQENENSVTSWKYETEEQRDNDFNVITSYY